MSVALVDLSPVLECDRPQHQELGGTDRLPGGIAAGVELVIERHRGPLEAVVGDYPPTRRGLPVLHQLDAELDAAHVHLVTIYEHMFACQANRRIPA